MNHQVLSLLTLLLLASTPVIAKDQKNTSKRTGDLVLSLVAVVERESNFGSSDHHIVAVRFAAKNIGQQALCVSFKATLKTTFNLEYVSYSAGRYPLLIHEMLPGEDAEGEYEFTVKNGTQPIEIVLQPNSESQTCTRGKDSFSSIWHSSPETKFDLTATSSVAAEKQTSPEQEQGGSAGPRVYLTNKNGDAPKEEAVRVFYEKCTQSRITKDKKKADYIVALSPYTFKQGKNEVQVTNRAGDLIYSGATVNLGNAAKDACAAILKDFEASHQLVR